MFSLNIVALFFGEQELILFQETAFKRNCVSLHLANARQVTKSITNPPKISYSCTVSSSPVVYAFLRDDTLLGSRWLKQVNKYTRMPVNAV
jgi:hypothetical protein